jgi:serine/threonine-protein kinase HipA
MVAKKTKSAGDMVEVYLDCEFTHGPTLVGRLWHDRGQVRFEYHEAWIANPHAFELDPGLTLDAEPFFPDPKQANFGVFLDSSPDRWGQMLMDRREAIVARDEKRQPRKLHAWDYLLGVQDATRMGALRFRRIDEEIFIDHHPLPAPPVADLRQIEAVAAEISGRAALKDLDQLRQWLAVLVAPGASLGGAHPKANYRESDGSLWIAKFPSSDDTRDNAVWEKLVHDMASELNIRTPPSVLKRFNRGFHTFCVKRFDRVGGARRFFVSAMTALRKHDGTKGSYLELAEFIQGHGTQDGIALDLEQLYRRLVFNIMIGNRDDHLRNHGFLWGEDGWRLAAAFDMNPSIDKREHVLTIDGLVDDPDIELAVATAGYYGIDDGRANEIVDNTRAIVSTWKERARKMRIAAGDIELTASAFSALDDEGGGRG